MSYSLSTLWYERARFLPGVLAVAFSALLIALQCGLLLGLFSITSLPIDNTDADIWMGAPAVLSVDLGESIPCDYESYLANQPEVVRTETYMQGFSYWAKPGGGKELSMVIGSKLEPDSLGRVKKLTPDLCDKLTLPGQTTYVLARCRSKDEARAVVDRMREQYHNLNVFTSDEFSLRSRMHWLTKTKAGIALGYAAALGLLVGAVVTYQTLSAATKASLREFAVLRALGIPRWRMAALVMSQSFWVGIIGVTLSLPAVYVLAVVADRLGVRVELRVDLLSAAAGITLVVALAAGLLALRALRQVEPATLLR